MPKNYLKSKNNFFNKNYLKKLFLENNFVPNKNEGQNFLLNNNFLLSYLEKNPLDKSGFCFELGSGFLAFSLYLAKYFKNFVAIEKNKKIFLLTEKLLPGKIFNYDFFSKECEELIDHNYLPTNNYFFSNLPYKLGNKIIISLSKSTILFDKYIFLLQKEVFDKMNAKINEKKYSYYSVYANFIFFKIKKISLISKNNFFPKPKVDSIFAEFSIRTNFFLVNRTKFLFFLKKLFLNRRKKLLYNLINNLDWITENAIFMLELFKINQNSRAQELTLFQIWSLFTCYYYFLEH
ncbi:hypothetical protein JTY60_00685 [symbiont of Argiope bruennichi]|uniref:rRNA adenine N-6-methyltransferase family protein n=1 Tax=symbiont of Argiope bruennichi TaxID=2810479 RepID=UPI003DA5CDFA